MKIRITEYSADWFVDRLIELDTSKYKSYSLSALGTNMIWTLDCYTKTGWNDRFFLAPSGNDIKKLVKELNITDIKENMYCKIK